VSKKTPFIGFGNETLDTLPPAYEGQLVDCKCGKQHALQCGTDKDGNKSTLVLFYKCGKNSYLGAVGGKLIVGQKADVSGKMSVTSD